MNAAMLCLALSVGAAHGLELDNGTFRLSLGTGKEGGPCILSGAWVKSGETAFTNAQASKGRRGDGDAWVKVDHPAFLRAETSQDLGEGLVMTRVVDLAREGSTFRVHVRMTNRGERAKAVSWFPVWAAAWDLEGGAERVSWWNALSFVPVEKPLTSEDIVLGSRLHSSDTRHSEGVNPYWVVSGDADTRLYFGLEWCGGWEATLSRSDRALNFGVRLPENETQLVLEPGESIAGPILNVTVTAEPDERSSRAAWMQQRESLAKTLYDGPAPAYPFVYNHWYAIRFDMDAAFLWRQIEHMEPYGFDYFVVDAGWYKACGQWEPTPSKFKEAEFETVLAASKVKGVPVGIWSCPQFIQADNDNLPDAVDQPGFYEKFIDGHLVDMAGLDYSTSLLNHVAMLRTRYGVDWWKYDQLLFAEETRHGVMKNVVAFQDALRAVRKANPDLCIENCQSGGRMINEFTVLATQTQWIRDGGGTGLSHARSNLRETLGAMQFLPPWACTRWTNNPDRNDPDDDELTRCYMRSAMPGVWGLCANLGNIQPHQRDVILREIANYRRLNELKKDCLYDVHYPKAGAQLAGVTFYSADGSQAAVLLIRWAMEEEIEQAVPLPGLRDDQVYRVEDVDSGAVAEVPGDALRDGAMIMSFEPDRMSALVFVEAK